MPGKKSAKVRVAPHEVEDTILRQEPILLTLEERTALRGMLTSAVFKKALHNARLVQPTAFLPQGVTDSALGSISANNQLHRMQGWAMFERALGRQVENPKPPAPAAPDDYKRER